MGLWYIQTWSVSREKIEEHVEIMKKLMSKFGKNTKYFRKMWGPLGGRVGVMEFEDMADYGNFFAKLDKMETEEDWQLRKEFLKCIEYNTWKAVFWNES